MDPKYFSAVAALAGSFIGGLTSLASTWLSQNAQARAEQLAHSRIRREELYKEFIEEASQLYADAFGNAKAELGKFVRLYALIGRMRIISPSRVVESAEKVARGISETYLAPNISFRDVEEAISSGAVDPLLRFSEVCRDELRSFGAVR